MEEIAINLYKAIKQLEHNLDIGLDKQKNLRQLSVGDKDSFKIIQDKIIEYWKI